MVLTDTELAMLEMLTYLTSSVAKAAGKKGFSFTKADGSANVKTISEILEIFDEEALEALRQLGDTDLGYVSAKEWAGIISYIQSSRLADLVLSDVWTNSDGATVALCFVEDISSDEAVVAFRGTVDGDEWVDNVEGLNTSDTDCQKEALDYIESLPYGSITVTGHSKGGNKAMYVAITSDKVKGASHLTGRDSRRNFWKSTGPRYRKRAA